MSNSRLTGRGSRDVIATMMTAAGVAGMMATGCGQKAATVAAPVSDAPVSVAVSSAPVAPSGSMAQNSQGIADRYRFYNSSRTQAGANPVDVPVGMAGGAATGQSGNSSANQAMADRYNYYNAHRGQSAGAATPASPAAPTH